MVQYTETQHALEAGVDTLSPEKGVELIEKWEENLKNVEASGAKGILRDLGQLKNALRAGAPDSGKIKTLLKKLGQETADVADEADGTAPDKLRDLGKGLQQAAA